ncbi:MAG: DUF4956 domain-containing protein [Myxococcales bacterium]|nr:DUF4956 domain-containing protein [Myxococcales bacterium]
MRSGLDGPPRHPTVWLGAYYGTLALGVYALSQWFPGLIELATSTTPAVVDLQDAFGPVAQPPAASGVASMVPLGAGLLAALALSLPVSWTYMGARSRRGFDASVVQTIVILPIAVVGITSIVQHNIALAFSLAGIAAGVRFRNALKDTSDALYIFAAIGIGLATGTGQITTAFLVSAFFNLANLLFWNPEVAEALEKRPEEGKVLSAVQSRKSRRKATRMVAKAASDGTAAGSEPPYEPARRSAGS